MKLQIDITSTAKVIAGFLANKNKTSFGEEVRKIYHRVDCYVGQYKTLKEITSNLLHNKEKRFDYLSRTRLLHDYLHAMQDLKEEIVVPLVDGFDFELVHDYDLDFSKLSYVGTYEQDWNFSEGLVYKDLNHYGIINHDGTVTVFKDNSIQSIPKKFFFHHLLEKVSHDVVVRLMDEGKWNFTYLSENWNVYTDCSTFGEFDLNEPFELI